MTHILALTGASGAPYFLRTLERLNAQGITVELISSKTGRQVLQHETGRSWEEVSSGYHVYDENDFAARIASGSSPVQSMTIVPCSMSTLAHIAGGLSANLIHRTASVQLKERRPLIVVPRESPYSLIHLKTMTTLTEAGGIVLPASPGFYHEPKTIEALVDSVVDRILDHMHCPDGEMRRWRN